MSIPEIPQRRSRSSSRPAGQSRRLACLGLLALAAGTLTGCGSSQVDGRQDAGTLGAATSSSSQYVEPGERTLTPTLQGTTLTGEQVDIASMRGDVVVVNIWGSWCAPCRKEAPELQKLAKETKSLGVTFLGIDIRDSKDAALAFERNYGITYPSIYDRDGSVMTAFKQLAPRAVPTTYVLDRTGKVAALSIGPLSYRGFLPVIEDIAAEDA